jgi:hypothetical protein
MHTVHDGRSGARATLLLQIAILMLRTAMPERLWRQRNALYDLPLPDCHTLERPDVRGLRGHVGGL